MSTDRKRLTSAIQRIAREDPEIRKLLDEFRNSGGKPSSSATTGSGAEDRQTCCDGSSSGNANPGSSTKDPSEGGADGLDSDDPANLDSGPGSLTGVKDCETNEPICFDGSDWIPPDNWDSPTDPGPAEGYDQGFYYCRDVECQGSGGPFGNGTYYTLCDVCSDFEYECDADPNGTPWCIRDGSGQFFYPPKKECTQNQIDSGTGICGNPDPPLATEWPEDGCVNLAQKGGKLVGSKYDPENDGSWSKPRDSVELCDDFGNSFELKPSSSGGWKTISAQNPDDGYLYNSNGEQIARISGSEFSDPNV